MIERKTLAFADLMVKSEGDGDPGTLEGYGNVTGNLDRAGEIVERGAYKNLADLVLHGAGLVGHEWGDLPIATLEEAREDEKGLYFRWKFHSTDAAQEARTVIRERMERGKSAALSIGYRVIDSAYETRDGKDVRVLKAIEVYEISFVVVPANAAAMATGVKGAGVPLDDQVNAVRESLKDLCDRLTGLKELRGHLSASRREEFAAILEQGKALLDLTQPEPDPVDEAALADLARFAAGL